MTNGREENDLLRFELVDFHAFQPSERGQVDLVVSVWCFHELVQSLLHTQSARATARLCVNLLALINIPCVTTLSGLFMKLDDMPDTQGGQPVC